MFEKKYDQSYIADIVERNRNGASYEEIFKDFSERYPDTPYSTFERAMRRWKEKVQSDDKILETANLSYKFQPHGSTVRVDSEGKIVEAWIKQHAGTGFERLIETIQACTPHVIVEPKIFPDSNKMLEIPLFDMHFGIADFNYYRPVLERLLGKIGSHHWKQINIIIGQDLLHNDDMRGRTSKGTPIEQVDMPKAWEDARSFWTNVIDAALQQSESVRVIYSKGNHDESMSWAFVQMLRERYGKTIVDDSLNQWKCISWERVFIGISHGDKGPKKPAELAALFSTKFPIPWAFSEVREIHLGHLHTEADADPPGARVRRLGAGNIKDEWTIDNGFSGGQHRFSIFEWEEDRLSDNYYL